MCNFTRPWRIKESMCEVYSDTFGGYDEIQTFDIIDANGNEVICCNYQMEDEVNLIVGIVNQHDSLVQRVAELEDKNRDYIEKILERNTKINLLENDNFLYEGNLNISNERIAELEAHHVESSQDYQILMNLYNEQKDKNKQLEAKVAELEEQLKICQKIAMEAEHKKGDLMLEVGLLKEENKKLRDALANGIKMWCEYCHGADCDMECVMNSLKELTKEAAK